MDKEALIAARKEYDRAEEFNKKLFKAVGNKDHFNEFQNAWSSLLLSIGRIYTKLEQGSKSSPKSRAWWARKLYERRHDELLCYLWHARNAEEHTLREATERVEITHTGFRRRERPIGQTARPNPLFETVEETSVNFWLVDVVDRGKIYKAPRKRGELNITPIGVAGEALRYVSSMLTEAEELAK
jgi:hypothetical protein